MVQVALIALLLGPPAQAASDEMPEVGAPKRVAAAATTLAGAGVDVHVDVAGAARDPAGGTGDRLAALIPSNRAVAAVAASLNVLGLGIIVIAIFLFVRARQPTAAPGPGLEAAPQTDHARLDAARREAMEERTRTPVAEEDETLIVVTPQAPAAPGQASAAASGPATSRAEQRRPVSSTDETFMPEELRGEVEPIEVEPAAPAVPITYGWLEDLDGVTRSDRFDIHHQQVNIGRARARDNAQTTYLHIRRNTIGRRHATLRITDEGFFIEDHHSINGTFVNGVRIVGPTAVKHGDLVTFDEFRFRLHVPFGSLARSGGARETPLQHEKTIVLQPGRYECARRS